MNGCPVAARRARIAKAIAYLKHICILVDPVDRSDLVRRYRVSGKREPMYAEQVIEFAIDRGMADG